jgi:phospholipid/cholesterol/gamma-HCH transport system substrate-binding protein
MSPGSRRTGAAAALGPSSRLGWLFLAGSLLLAGWVGKALVEERLRWRDSTVVRFRTADATGIWPGVNVTLSGYRIGRVAKVRLADDGMVDVNLRIAAPYRRLIGPDSIATTSQEGLIGDGVVVLTPDITPAGRKPPRVDLRVAYRPGVSPAELLEELTATRLKLDRTLQGIAVVVEKDLPRAIGSFDGTLRDVRRLAGTVERETGTTAAVTRDTLRVIQDTGQQVQETGEQVGTTSEAATATLENTSPVLVDTLREVGSLSGNINRLLRAIGGSLLLELDEPETGQGADAETPMPPPSPDSAPEAPPAIPGRG